MEKIGTQRRSKKQQAIAAELGLIIDHMAQAMWNANRGWVASSESPLTYNMNNALIEFQDFCARNPE